MTKELQKRFITSFFLLSLLTLAFNYNYVLIISVLIISSICWFEFNNLVIKIFKKKKSLNKFNIFLTCLIGLIYIFFFSFIIISGFTGEFKMNMLFFIALCISSDIGGLVFGKIFKGKKLTKISPNKTISGSIGSFIFSILTMLIFFSINDLTNLNLFFLLTIVISTTSQLGDLFFSYLKRKANVKDTGNILPGHGGFLDRLDGIFFAVPIGFILNSILII
jgi:phosphatidate cytidylyltransferase